MNSYTVSIINENKELAHSGQETGRNKGGMYWKLRSTMYSNARGGGGGGRGGGEGGEDV